MANESAAVLEQTVSHDSSVLRNTYPGAELFQVAFFGLSPKVFSATRSVDTSIRSWYTVGTKDRYIEVRRRSVSDPEAAPEVIEKQSQADCQKAYPLPGSLVCEPSTSGIEAKPTPLKTQEVSRLARLPEWIARAGMDLSALYDVTITTADQFETAMKSTNRNLEIASALERLNPTETIVSVTMRSGDRSKLGSTVIFEAQTGVVLGTYKAPPSRLPPAPGR